MKLEIKQCQLSIYGFILYLNYINTLLEFYKNVTKVDKIRQISSALKLYLNNY